MNLAENNFFGPQEFYAMVTEYPPYQTKIKCTRYGYETRKAILDVVIPEREIRLKTGEYIKKYYLINGEVTLTPLFIHKAVERKFNL